MEQAPQRQNLSELIYDPNITLADYWNGVNSNLLASARLFSTSVGEVAAINSRLVDYERKFRNINPDVLANQSPGAARTNAYETYRRIGALQPSEKLGELAIALAVSYGDSHTRANDYERATQYFETATVEDLKETFSESALEKKRLTFANFLSSMLYETGVVYETPQSVFYGQSAALADSVEVKDMEHNVLAVTEMLRRTKDIQFREIYESPMASPDLTKHRFKRLQREDIRTFQEWLNHPNSDVGLAFEWLVAIAYRDYIYRHGLFHRAFIRGALPREDYPVDGMRGRPIDNLQAIDNVVEIDGKPMFIQCKIAGVDYDQLKDLDDTTSVNRWYARPIRIVTAIEADNSERDSNEETSQKYFQRRFYEQSQQIMARYGHRIQDDNTGINYSTSYDRMFERKKLVVAA